MMTPAVTATAGISSAATFTPTYARGDDTAGVATASSVSSSSAITPAAAEISGKPSVD